MKCKETLWNKGPSFFVLGFLWSIHIVTILLEVGWSLLFIIYCCHETMTMMMWTTTMSSLRDDLHNAATMETDRGKLCRYPSHHPLPSTSLKLRGKLFSRLTCLATIWTPSKTVASEDNLTSRRRQITHPFCHRVIINSKVKKEKSLLQERLDLHSSLIVNNDSIGKVTKNVNAKTQKNVNAKNTNEHDLNSLITQPFKFHQGLKEKRARPNLFLGQY